MFASGYTFFAALVDGLAFFFAGDGAADGISCGSRECPAEARTGWVMARLQAGNSEIGSALIPSCSGCAATCCACIVAERVTCFTCGSAGNGIVAVLVTGSLDFLFFLADMDAETGGMLATGIHLFR